MHLDLKNRNLLKVMIVSCIAVLMLTLGLPASAAAKPPTYIVKPNGHDDTANIQAAFNAAVAHGPGCTVQLEKGTYYTAQITVYGFQGRFVGMGQGSTIIQALPNLPSPAPEYNTPYSPFWAGLPGPKNPWPMLFTFVNGSFSISGMTLTDPYTTPISSGWYHYYTWYLPGTPYLFTCLLAAIEITGLQTFATIDHVTVLGASGDAYGTGWGTNMWNAIIYEGAMLPKGWTNAFTDVIPLSGTFSLTNSVFNSMGGILVDTLISARVRICDNTFTNSPFGPGFYDVSNSRLLFNGNRGLNVTYGYGSISGYQSLFKTSGLLPSTVYITDNDFQVNRGATAVVLADFGTVSTLRAVVSRNVFQTDTSYGGYFPTEPLYYSVIISYSLKSVVVSGNTILRGGSAGVYVVGGPGVVSGNVILGSYVGVWLDYANGVRVTGNVIKNSAEWGIALTDGSSNNLVTGNIVMHSGVYDLYWDGTGTGNLWKGNLFKTSSPPGLH